MEEVNRCTICGEPLTKVMFALGILSHPACTVPTVTEPVSSSTSVFSDPGAIPLPELAADLKAELMTIVRWDTEFAPRSKQVRLGPSDLGATCDRRLAYKIAGLQGNHQGDPLPAYIGSAVHTKLEESIRRYAQQHGGAWLIEEKVVVDPLIRGSADLVRAPLVVDIKTAGKTMMDKVKKEGPPEKYLTQINLYAKGLRDAGHDITQVAFLFVPREGWLTSTYAWAAPYDETIARRALVRTYALARKLTEMGIRDHPERWAEIPSAPEFGECTYCSMYSRHRTSAEVADGTGCPGFNK